MHIDFRGVQLRRGGRSFKEMVVKRVSQDAGPKRSPPCLALKGTLVTLAWAVSWVEDGQSFKREASWAW